MAIFNSYVSSPEGIENHFFANGNQTKKQKHSEKPNAQKPRPLSPSARHTHTIDS